MAEKLFEVRYNGETFGGIGYDNLRDACESVMEAPKGSQVVQVDGKGKVLKTFSVEDCENALRLPLEQAQSLVVNINADQIRGLFPSKQKVTSRPNQRRQNNKKIEYAIKHPLMEGIGKGGTVLVQDFKREALSQLHARRPQDAADGFNRPSLAADHFSRPRSRLALETPIEGIFPKSDETPNDESGTPRLFPQVFNLGKYCHGTCRSRRVCATLREWHAQ